MGERRPNNVLMLYPRFVADTFWSFAESCKLMGARRPTAPPEFFAAYVIGIICDFVQS